MGRNQSKNRIGRFQRKRIHRAQLRDTYRGRVEREPRAQIRNAIEFQNENVISTGRSARDSLYSTPMARARSRVRLDAQYFDVLSLEWPVRADKVRPFVVPRIARPIYIWNIKILMPEKFFFSMYLCIYVGCSMNSNTLCRNYFILVKKKRYLEFCKNFSQRDRKKKRKECIVEI